MSIVTGHSAGTPSWFDLMSPDLVGARAFYKALFGWDYFINGPEMAHYTLALKHGQPAAGIGPRPPDAAVPSVWSVYFDTKDIQASLDAVVANGGSVMFGPHKVGETGHMAMAFDPTGAAFGLWQAGKHLGAGVTGEHGAMAWSELYTRGSEAALGFYAAVLGLTHKPLPGMAYWTLHDVGNEGEPSVAGVMQMTEEWPENIPPHWRPYFAVDNTDDAINLVKGNGGALVMPAFDTPYGRMAVVEDPYGATFSIIQLPSQPAA